MRRSTSIAAALFGLVLCGLQPAVAAAGPPGGPVAGGRTTLELDADLQELLAREGVELVALRPAKGHGRTVSMPVSEGMLESTYGSGYVFQQGGFRFRSGHRKLTVFKPVLNTAKRRLSATVAGKAITIASVDDVHARRSDFGIDVKVGELRFTKRAARIFDRELGLRDVFERGHLLGAATIATESFTVPVRGGRMELSLDEGFRQKLESLGVAISPYEAATALSPAPPAYSFPVLKGDIERHLAHGGIGTGRDGIRLVQAGVPESREVIWGPIGINFENGFGGVGSDVVTARWGLPLGVSAVGPIGQIEFGTAPGFDPSTSTITGAPTAATLSPYAAAPLNDAFAPGRQSFVAGEPLGTFSFVARLR
jgi:hypothetical protein